MTPIELMDRVRADVAADQNSSIFKSKGTKIAAISIVLAWVGITFLFLEIVDIEKYW